MAGSSAGHTVTNINQRPAVRPEADWDPYNNFVIEYPIHGVALHQEIGERNLACGTQAKQRLE